jgi:hypothetical protein
MKKFHLEFATDNAAFEGSDLHTECERILRAVAERVGSGREEGTIADINGNTVGNWWVEADE